MKTVTMERDFVYRPKRNIHISYRAGLTYRRVPEAAVRAILEARKGRIVVNERSEH
jgi:hypothetical protein